MSAADPKDVAVQAEAGRLNRDAIVQSMRVLTFFEAWVIGETYGLWGKPIRTNAQIAERAGTSMGEVRRAKASAVETIRARLTEMGHPAVTAGE